VTAQLIDGKTVAARIRGEVAEAVAHRAARGLRVPGLVTVLVGDDPASKVYVGGKQRQAKEVGLLSEAVELPATTSQDALLDVVRAYNRRDDIDGILVQLPLPEGLDPNRVIAEISPDKDVDGLHPVNQGALLAGSRGLRPCTPLSCMELIAGTGRSLRGAHAVVIGRSALVGKPVALLLLERDATVVMCHSKTADLAGEVARADVVVAAVGRPQLVRGDWIKPGAVVIDVGINRIDGKLVGDVEFARAAERASFITPVPGGVGPMTIAMLLKNTLSACQARTETEPAA